MKTCVVPGCPEARWTGPHGDQTRLTMCEKHQRAYWRKRKTPNPKRQQRLKGEPKPTPTPRVRKPTKPAPPQVLKIVLVDHAHDMVQRFDVEVLHDKKLSDIRNAGRLLDFYRKTGHVVVEIGKKE